MAKAKKLPSGNWRCRAYIGKDASGKDRYKSFTAPTKKEAEALAAVYALQKKEERTAEMTVGQAIDRYIIAKENVLSPTTIDSYKRQRKNCLQNIIDLQISQLTSNKMQIAVNIDASRLSPKTVHCAYGFFCSAIKMFYPDFSVKVSLPAKQKKLKELPEAIDIIKAVTGTEIELPCLLALWLSLRMSEVRGVKYSDIAGDVMTVRETIVTVSGEHIVKKQTKTYGSTRQLHVPPYLMELIKKQRESAESDNECIVKMSGQAIYKRFSRLLERKGLPHMTFHDLRHLNASVMLMLGVPDKYAMERGGWTSNYTLQQVYQHTFSSERKKVDEKIDMYFENLINGMT